MRRFVFTDGKSDKFWEIELNNTSYTVRYGRMGTSGSEKIKDFKNAERAKKEYERSINSKVNKGYREEENVITTATAKNSESKPLGLSPTPETNPFNLSDYYLSYPSWVPYPYKEIQDNKKSDLVKLIDKIKRKSSILTPMDEELVKTLNMPQSLSKEESIILIKETGKQGYYRYFNDIDLTNRDSVQTYIATLRTLSTIQGIALTWIFGFDTIIDWLFTTGSQWSTSILEALSNAVSYLMPYQSKDRRKELMARAQELYTLIIQNKSYFPGLIYGVSAFKLNSTPLWEAYEQSNLDLTINDLGELVRSLPSQELVISKLEETKVMAGELRDYTVKIPKWLSTAGFACIDKICDKIQKETYKDWAKELITPLLNIDQPEIAYTMFTLSESSKVSDLAWNWINTHQGTAATGLTIYVCQKEQNISNESLLNTIRLLAHKGYHDEIERVLQKQTEDIKKRVRDLTLDYDNKLPPELTEETTPHWLSTELNQYKELKSSIIDPFLLPKLVISEGSLSLKQVSQLLQFLKTQNISSPGLFVDKIKTNISQKQLDNFVWSLFQIWLKRSAPSKEKWMMLSVGILGGDDLALRLEPLIRTWPGESQHQRAVTGLRVLEAIGSDTALMVINGIARKVKFAGIKKNAAKVIQSIAKKRGLTAEALEDRIIPDCGLDNKGTRFFDYGNRGFTVSLDKDLKPVVKNEEGKALANLPKPNKKDDQEKAKEALANWKLIKKQIKDTAKIQATRLEQAMVIGRKWTVDEFVRFFIKHPLMRHISTRILWKAINTNDKTDQLFRITEELEITNEEDDVITLDSFNQIILIHPLEMTKEEKQSWGQIFSDYEIIPPFNQIGRQVYLLEDSEKELLRIERYKDIKLPAPTLVFGLEKAGWIRGVGLDAGSFDEHSRYFPSSNITVIATYDGAVGMGYIEAEEKVNFNYIYFVKGQREPDGYYESDKKKKDLLSLNEVPPMIISEVISDISLLTLKAE
ncbi:WGR and DUF4132 domain-containing protein [Spirochaeta cellobiosiphila]|uniref:WGR and DUF4132 domain-containing protein n=1 Tax=Spirochaeta cellobiosiphila TaxID=504483 RepID=UPI000419A9FA|nr:DUF4132 domain-containing protein [Spirochaeta cellobiosiphila]